MKTRFLSLFLCALMLASVLLVGCGDRTEEEIIKDIAESARQPYTLSLWIPTNASTTQAEIDKVEAAINELLKQEYSTQIELHAIKDSEYEAAVLARMKEVEAKLAAGSTQANKIVHETKVIKTEGGTYETVYPEMVDTQMDIFLVRGKSDFTTLISEKRISSLHTQITGKYRALTKHIYPTLMDAGLQGATYYGVPVNHVIGEYTLAIVDKALADEYELDTTTVSSLADMKEFLVWASEKGVALSAQDADINEADSEVYAELKAAGCVGTSDAAAVKLVKGDFVDIEEYSKDSYVVKYTMPTLTEEDKYASIFAISTYTISIDRSMEILAFLNTNREMKTLLQYGIAGDHYELVYEEDDIDLSDPTIKILKDTYSMNTLYTGNVYKTYRGEGVTFADSWVTAKLQNLDTDIPQS